MAISRKPKANSDINIDDLIAKGGDVASAKKTPVKEAASEKQQSIRMPMPLYNRLDKLLKQRMIRMPKHTWILSAIAEKLEREENHNLSNETTE